MYLRETRRTRKDGSTVRYLQLAHNYRDPDTGHAIAKILYSFGRADLVDRTALERLVGSVSRFLDQEPPNGTSGEVEPVDGRDLGGAWVLDQLWDRLGIGKAIVTVARGRKLDASAVERALFALVASRALAPSSKLEATRWVREEVHIDRLAEIDTDSCYRAMDLLLESLPELQETVFFTVADLLQLDVDLLFFDTTSTYFELEQADVDPDDDTEPGFRSHGHSKDHRDDLPQVVIGMAVTRGGVPVRLWVWPGNTTDTTVMAVHRHDSTTPLDTTRRGIPILRRWHEAMWSLTSLRYCRTSGGSWCAITTASRQPDAGAHWAAWHGARSAGSICG